MINGTVLYFGKKYWNQPENLTNINKSIMRKLDNWIIKELRKVEKAKWK